MASQTRPAPHTYLKPVSDFFGSSVSIDGTTAIVGAPGDDDNGPGSGAAYLFDITTGQQIAKILPDDGLVQDGFGIVAIAGTTALVGAPQSYTGEKLGSAYLFDVTVIASCPVTFGYPNGIPKIVDSIGGTTIRVVAVNGGGEPQPNTGILHVDRGSGFESFPMTEVSANVYDAVFPSSNCGSILGYYVSAENTNGEQFTDPPNAPAVSYPAVGSSDAGTVVFADNFETDLGWTVSGDATDGHWDRGFPADDGIFGDPLTDGDGSGSCYLTDNAAGNSDVDNGSTVLTSPIFDASGSGPESAVISYYRWYANSFGSNWEQDVFVVEISNDGGVSWVNLETVGPDGPETWGGWVFKMFRISDFVPLTEQMQVRFIASDTDLPSQVEAGVDGVEICLIGCDDIVVVSAVSFLVTRGSYVSGGITELADSDNLDLTIRRSNSDIQSRTEFEVDAVSPTASPSSLEVTLEGSVFARSQVNQSIELFDYVAGAWEPVDTRAATRFTDSTVTVAATGDLSRFVEAGTMGMKARIRYQSPVARQQFSSNTDQFIWTIIQ